jgi:hypothetical protein
MEKIKNISKVIRLNELEVTKNKVSTIDDSASDIQYPTAKVVKNVIDDLSWAMNFIKYNTTTICVPEDITVVDKNYLNDYPNLRVLYLHKNVTNVNIDNCDRLEKVIVDKDNQNFSNDENGMLFTKSGQTLVRCPKANSVSTYDLPDSVYYINDGAFSGCSNLTHIGFNGNITYIGVGTFSRCTNLSSVTFSEDINNITSIRDSAFYNCTSLTSITIPDKVTSIGEHAFRDCTSLTNITLSKNIKKINSCAFYNCNALTTITIPDKVTSIGDSAFRSCNSLTSAFFCCYNVNHLGNDIFRNCDKVIIKCGDGSNVHTYAMNNNHKFETWD